MFKTFLMRPPLAYSHYKQFLLYVANFTMIWRWWRNGGLHNSWVLNDKTNFKTRLGRANYLTCLPYSSFAQQRGGEGKKIKKIKNKNQ